MDNTTKKIINKLLNNAIGSDNTDYIKGQLDKICEIICYVNTGIKIKESE